MGNKLSNYYECKLARGSRISSEVMNIAELFDNDPEVTGIKGEGMAIPYYDLQGRIKGYRVGLKNPFLNEEGRKVKYLQLSGLGNIPYFLKTDIQFILNPRFPLFCTEGEKKLLALKSITKFKDIPAVSFPGAHNWQKKESGGQLTEGWEEIPVVGREIVLIADTDVFINPLVHLGYIRFIKAMIEKGAIVKLIDLRNGAENEK